MTWYRKGNDLKTREEDVGVVMYNEHEPLRVYRRAYERSVINEISTLVLIGQKRGGHCTEGLSRYSDSD